MLVLRRKQRESVILGDEVTLTVEEIRGGDGQRLFGATVRLGFEAPRHVSICRSELCVKGSPTGGPGRRAEPAEPQAGRLVEIPGAEARMRILVPRKIPVCCNGTPIAGLDREERFDRATRTPKTAYEVTCRKEDRITICSNIIIATFDFHYFVFT
ncbi:MAG TPA: carbon storage regulator [Thermoguttaceae bacterium]|nr:carbon storage regulator [Thermoguttaceae bacterium]